MTKRKLLTLTNSQFFTLDYLARHEGLPVSETKGRTFEQLLRMRFATVAHDRAYITAAGRKRLDEEHK